jgi:hypothetical protein
LQLHRELQIAIDARNKIQPTKESKDVFPPPIVPSRRNVGAVAARVADRYRKICSKSGKERETTKAIRIANGLPERSLERTPSSSHHFMVTQVI